jgi:hypothetical protein
MDEVRDRGTERVEDAGAGKRPPRFGSYLGLFYVAAIAGVLTWAVLRDTGTTHAFDRLEPGMTPTQVAALLGVPRSETTEGPRTVQTWKIPDGQSFQVEFESGRLVRKARTSGPLTRGAR